MEYHIIPINELPQVTPEEEPFFLQNYYVPIGVNPNLDQNQVNQNQARKLNIDQLQRTINLTPSLVSQSNNGLMSSDDKITLDNLVQNFNNLNSAVSTLDGSVQELSSTLGVLNLRNGSGEGSLRTTFSAEEDEDYIIGPYAFTQGHYTKARGRNSHAQGYSSQANGKTSYAQGYYAQANGDFSRSFGYQTIANASHQTVIGKFNKIQNDPQQRILPPSSIAYLKNSTNHTQIIRTLPSEPFIGSDVQISFEFYYENDPSFSPSQGTIILQQVGRNIKRQVYSSQYVEFNITYNGSKDLIFTLPNSTLSRFPDIYIKILQISYYLDPTEKNEIFIIGNGTADNNRLNLLEVTRNGNIAISGTPSKNNHVITKEYLDSYIQNNISNVITNFEDGIQSGSLRSVTASPEENGIYQLGLSAVAQGYLTKASGTNSHAEGRETIASGATSHAEGYETVASGSESHVEGDNTTASGAAAHAEGSETAASGASSHAEGFATLASGFSSHAQGQYTEAIGNSSFSAGKYTTAEGTNSTAFGDHTIAVQNNSFVIGEYNNTVSEEEINEDIENSNLWLYPMYTTAKTFTLNSSNIKNNTPIILYFRLRSDDNADYMYGNFSHQFTAGQSQVKVDSSHYSLRIQYNGNKTFTISISNSIPDTGAIIDCYAVSYKNTVNNIFVVGNGTSNNRSNAFTIESTGNAAISGTPLRDNHLVSLGFLKDYILNTLYPIGSLYGSNRNTSELVKKALGGEWTYAGSQIMENTITYYFKRTA